MYTTSLPETVNYHFTSACNMRCRYCFSGFTECNRGQLEQHLRIIRLLTETPGVKRINLVGGEPTVYPYLNELINEAVRSGLKVSLVTNGFSLVKVGIPDYFRVLDLIGISIDSLRAETNRRIGRAVGGRTISSAEWMTFFSRLATLEIPLKINTVVSGYNAYEDFSNFIREAEPKRWKVFEAMPVEGQNEQSHDEWAIDREAFDSFVARHRLAGIDPLVESTDVMRGSYAMISPDGCFYDSSKGYHAYSDPILEVGIQHAWEQVFFDQQLFGERTVSYELEVTHV